MWICEPFVFSWHRKRASYRPFYCDSSTKHAAYLARRRGPSWGSVWGGGAPRASVWPWGTGTGRSWLSVRPRWGRRSLRGLSPARKTKTVFPLFFVCLQNIGGCSRCAARGMAWWWVAMETITHRANREVIKTTSAQKSTWSRFACKLSAATHTHTASLVWQTHKKAAGEEIKTVSQQKQRRRKLWRPQSQQPARDAAPAVPTSPVRHAANCRNHTRS